MEDKESILKNQQFIVAALALLLVSPIGFAVPDYKADLNGDACLHSQNFSKLSNPYRQALLNNSPKAHKACNGLHILPIRYRSTLVM
jgi:hypothetical protein